MKIAPVPSRRLLCRFSRSLFPNLGHVTHIVTLLGQEVKDKRFPFDPDLKPKNELGSRPINLLLFQVFR